MLLSELERRDPGMTLPVLAIEPSELAALRHDYGSIVPDLTAEERARLDAVESVEAFLGELPDLTDLRVAEPLSEVHLHPHCHQKADDAQAGRSIEQDDPSLKFLGRLGFTVQVIPAGCCGMAGTFGYEAEHYELSQQVGELSLFVWVRGHPAAQVAATGAACRMQIGQGTGVQAEHPLVVAARALGMVSGGM